MLPEIRREPLLFRRPGTAAATTMVDKNREAIYPYPLCLVKRHFIVARRTKGVKVYHIMKMKQARPGLEKRALVVRLRRIKGQIESIERMVETDIDSSDVLMQVVSARRALKSFSEEVIESQLRAYVESAGNKPEGRQNLRSLLTVLERYVG
jgi:DNA-binding FrmR family transcriptional regulator